jgi:DNA-directed RNA polymerase specialized sigma subunit
MSRVICFRLDENNPREAKVLALIFSQQEAGFTIRQVMVNALLKLSMEEVNELPVIASELRIALGEVHILLNKMQNEQFVSVSSETENSDETRLTEGFLESVRQAAKPGMKIG